MTYRERLWVPAAYWVIGLFFGLSTVTAMSFMLGDAWVLGSAAVCVGGVAWALLAYGSLAVGVDDAGVRVGRGVLEWPYVGGVEVLDEAETRRRLGRDSDPRAFLAVRPYLRRAVEIRVADPADPHPCWLVSSRRPVQFAAAIAAGLRNDPTRRPSGSSLDSRE